MLIGHSFPALEILISALARETIHRGDDLGIPTVILTFATLVHSVVTFVVELMDVCFRGFFLWKSELMAQQ